MKRYILIIALVATALISPTVQAEASTTGEHSCVTSYVNPFVGTSNYGTTNPGAVCPIGMMSATPFNVMGSELNRYDKD